MTSGAVFEEYLTRWSLVADGEPICTPTSRLLPVRSGNVSAMLKIAVREKPAGHLLRWWDGHGAARVLAHGDDAVLLERARPGRSLVDLVRSDQDDEASRIACAVVAKLHSPRSQSPPSLPGLAEWFAPLRPASEAQGGILRRASDLADELLASPRDRTVLHGDVHHDNILDFGTRGWLAIDPKGLIGERYFDYTNLFCNPDVGTATSPGRLARRIDVVARAAKLERRRLLRWVIAWAGLSAAFQIEDDLPAGVALTVAELAAAELDE